MTLTESMQAIDRAKKENDEIRNSTWTIYFKAKFHQDGPEHNCQESVEANTLIKAYEKAKDVFLFARPNAKITMFKGAKKGV